MCGGWCDSPYHKRSKWLVLCSPCLLVIIRHFRYPLAHPGNLETVNYKEDRWKTLQQQFVDSKCMWRMRASINSLYLAYCTIQFQFYTLVSSIMFPVTLSFFFIRNKLLKLKCIIYCTHWLQNACVGVDLLGFSFLWLAFHLRWFDLASSLLCGYHQIYWVTHVRPRIAFYLSNIYWE